MVKAWRTLGYSDYSIEQSRKARLKRWEADKIRQQEARDYDKKLKESKDQKTGPKDIFLKGNNKR